MAIGTETLPPLALIAGPTASGKSELALALAERCGGIIINADSAQLYCDLPVLSAAPDTAQRARADHRLYAVRDGAMPCSAAQWAAMARTEIRAAHDCGRLPILVGGTGLYLRTLLDGIAPVPTIDPQVREQVRSAELADNRDRLKSVDPAAYERLHPADRARIGRALEVILSTGCTLADWQKRKSGGIGGSVRLSPLVLLPPRDWLYQRCDRRFDAMIDAGAADEVRRLLNRSLPPDLPVMRAIGVREIAAWLSGRCSRADMLIAGRQATRRYAKRQYTWFSRQPPADWARFSETLDKAGIAAALALVETCD